MSRTHREKTPMAAKETLGRRGRGVARRGCDWRRAAALGLVAAAAGLAGGCRGVDGWLWDPSVVGRWEETPTITPILERIDVIEADSDEFVNVTPVRPEDLIPQPIEYRVSPGDLLVLTIEDFQATGRQSVFEVPVDNRGFIRVPRLEPIRVEGLSAGEIQNAIAAAIIEANILRDPAVNVMVPGQRQATFAIYGAVPAVGRYAVPYPDYRVLDALTDAGGISPTLPYVYIIRQVTLTDDETTEQPPSGARSGGGTGQPSGGGEGEEFDIDDLLEQLSQPEGDGAEPGAMSGEELGSALDRRILDLMAEVEASGSYSAAGESAGGANDWRSGGPAMSAMQPADGADAASARPTIDLEDAGGFEARLGDAQDQPSGEAAPMRDQRPSEWVYLDGEWQRVTVREAAGGAAMLDEAADPLAADADGELVLVTERVIRIPTQPLLEGVARFNAVVRPGDLISVPVPQQGVVYVAGPGIARPGVYTLSPQTRLTMRRLVASAGGLSAIGVPERVDLVRMVGPNHQATIKLNVRAIFEGTAPDVIIKKDDLVNFGTSFWSTPLAVIRGGFRASYGFGFLLDRNFGNDVFGPPPTDDRF